MSVPHCSDHRLVFRHALLYYSVVVLSTHRPSEYYPITVNVQFDWMANLQGASCSCLNNVYCLSDSVHCSLDNVHCSLDNVHCSLDNVHYLLDSVNYLFDNVHCSLDNVYCLELSIVSLSYNIVTPHTNLGHAAVG